MIQAYVLAVVVLIFINVTVKVKGVLNPFTFYFYI